MNEAISDRDWLCPEDFTDSQVLISSQSSPFYDRRPAQEVSLLVIHCIDLLTEYYGPQLADKLFTGELAAELNRPFYSAEPHRSRIVPLKAEFLDAEGALQSQYRVSVHFLIDREGILRQYVPLSCRAWHAGQSEFIDSSGTRRSDCNDFSIGIELLATAEQVGPSNEQLFSDQQYSSLIILTNYLIHRYPIAAECIVGHQHIAPGRKQDPGPGFDWARYRAGLQWSSAVSG